MRLRGEADALIFELIDERREDAERPRRRARDAARRPPRGRLADVAPGAARRADDAARRRPRDDRLPARLGVRAAGPRPARCSSAWPTRFATAARSDAYLTATIQESLRRRPVLPNAGPRLVRQPVEIGGWDYPPGVCLVANAYLIHHDPDDLPRPLRLPARALPRRAARHLHLDPVRRRPPPLPRRELRAARDEDRAARRRSPGRRGAPPPEGAELTRRRSITFSPGGGAVAVLKARTREPVAA